MNKINEIEKMLSEANELLLELKKENETLKQENLTLNNKILLLEKMISDLKAPKSKRDPKNNNEKSLKQDIELLELISDKKHFFHSGLLVLNNQFYTKNHNLNYSLKIESKDFLIDGFYDLELYKNGIYSNHKECDRLDKLNEYYLKENTFNNHIELDSIDFLKAIEKTSLYMHKDNCSTQGIFIQSDTNYDLHLVATDSFRLIKNTIKTLKHHEKDISLLIPSNIIKALIKDLKGTNCVIRIFYNENKKEFSICYLNRDIYCKGVDLPFPNYQSIFDNIKASYYFEGVASQILEFCKKAQKITKNNSRSEGSDGVTFEVLNNKITLTVNAKNNVSDTITLDAFSNNESIKFCLSCNFLVDILKNHTEKNIKFEFESNKSAFCFDYRDIIIMPLALIEV